MNPACTTFIRSLLACTACLLGACAMRANATPEQPMHATSVTLERSPCYGNCPSYTVTVSADGQINLAGHAHVQVGMRSMRDSYVGSDDGCKMVMSDQPGVKITVVDAEGSKTVDFYNGCTGGVADAVRRRIEQLAWSIDQQLDTARWIGKPAAPGAGGVEKADR